MNREQDIRKLAHEIWEKEGRPEGRASDHWKKAEGMVAAASSGRGLSSQRAAKTVLTKTAMTPKATTVSAKPAVKVTPSKPASSKTSPTKTTTGRTKA